VRDRPVSWEAFSRWLESVTLRRGPDLLRMKGIINIAEYPDEPVVIHGVQDVFHPPVQLDSWPTGDRRTRIVFITRNIDRRALENTLVHFEVADGEQSDREPQDSSDISPEASLGTSSQHLDKVASQP
jgi:G3E family GTPase